MSEGYKKTGFTVIELLTSMAIIALLIGILIPSLTMVRNIAKETAQRAHFIAIEQGIMAFRNDYGNYPPSYHISGLNFDPAYCGAQKLAEALLGWDLLGFQPITQRYLGGQNFISNGLLGGGAGGVYDPTYRDERVGPYLELATANAFRLGDLYAPSSPGILAPNTHVLCDSFAVKKITIPPITPSGQAVTVKAGTPILYYRANSSSVVNLGTGPVNLQPYNMRDNSPIVEGLNSIKKGLPHPLADPANNYEIFYTKIADPKIYAATGRLLPYNPDSYILISAGLDGLYGTDDDITNFGD